ncbi:7302_t:CDS:2 [Paraglomus occultum]|uniref:7302_t:CDS:1 n=1 Tax=Paraglomus occultum TaxID=144539 RepID=A0A9N8ZU27_9GLOM|nr:7302_t:CDS:2 [Paraglomus occultum]
MSNDISTLDFVDKATKTRSVLTNCPPKRVRKEKKCGRVRRALKAIDDLVPIRDCNEVVNKLRRFGTNTRL